MSLGGGFVAGPMLTIVIFRSEKYGEKNFEVAEKPVRLYFFHIFKKILSNFRQMVEGICVKQFFPPAEFFGHFRNTPYITLQCNLHVKVLQGSHVSISFSNTFKSTFITRRRKIF